MHRIIALVFIVGASVSSYGQSTDAFKAKRTATPPKIDGVLDAGVWDSNSEAFMFVQREPDNGASASFGTQVQMRYDDKALYIIAVLLDDQPDLISRELGLRDDSGKNVDLFTVVLDTYNKGLNGLEFGVTAAGVQTDAYITGGNFDSNWDAVWKSAVAVNESGWVVEMEIPYYAIRFAKQDIQLWGINFSRRIQRKKERSYWHYVDRSVQGVVNQSGLLEGIQGVEPPLRLAFMPYVSAVHTVDQASNSKETKIKGGMDLKYGINESFTVDMSLIPDFSQVQSDDQVLNLSASEVRFNENRPFFTEGTELFNKGGMFYSRRVGKSFADVPTQSAYDHVLESPGTAPLLNATKISGRTKKGLGIGLFNGITNKTHATIVTPTDVNGAFELDDEGGRVYAQYDTLEVQVDPLTNFNVFVLDQNLKNNSNIALINTNVMRADGGEDVNFTGLEFKFLDKKNTYQFDGFGAMGIANDKGFKYSLSAGKVSGTWQYEVSRYVESDDYDPNDLGFLRSNNELGHRAEISYNIYKPGKIFNQYSIEANFRHSKLYKPSTLQSWEMGYEFEGQFKNFWFLGFDYFSSPSDSYDFFYNSNTAAEVGFLRPENSRYEVSLSTDSRKALYVEMYKGEWKRSVWNQHDHWHGMYLRFRANNKLSFTYNLNYNREYNSIGWVQNFGDIPDDIKLANDLDGEVLFGNRYITRINNVLGVNYVFNNKMGLNVRVRHNWSTVDYFAYTKLLDDGQLESIAYDGLSSEGESIHNRNFNAFNLDLNYSWQIAPGSFVTFNWKDSIVNYSGSVTDTYSDNFRNTLKQSQQNSFSIKLTYFIDYITLKNSI